MTISWHCVSTTYVSKKRATTTITTYEYAYIPNGRNTEDEIIINLSSKITGLIHAHAKCTAFRIFWIFDAKTQCNTSTIEMKSEKTSLSEKWNDKWIPPTTEDTYLLLKCYECCWINMKIFAHPRLLLYYFLFFCWLCRYSLADACESVEEICNM